MSHSIDVQRIVQFFETLSRDKLADIDRVYSSEALFRDPFNEVSGLDAITRIYRHMFDQVDMPRFSIKTTLVQGEEAFLIWDFHFRMKRYSTARQRIHGASHLRFDADGRIRYHRDYWDAAEELYEKLPVLGTFMRMLKRVARR